MNRTLLATLMGVGLLATPAMLPAQLLITEVIPGQNTVTTRGDAVELYNGTGSPVDLTDYILSDLDPFAVESDVLAEGTFAPASLNLPPLGVGEFAVVQFVDSTGGTPFSYTATNYGLEILAPLATNSSSYLGVSYDQVLLTDASGTPIDFVAWGVTDDSPSVSSVTDYIEDLSALTGPTAEYGLTLGDAEWAGPDTVVDLTEYRNNVVDFTGLDSVSTYGGGVIQRRSTNGVFSVGSPDSLSDWEALPRFEATLGNPSDDVATSDGIKTIKMTGDVAAWLTEIDSSFFPDRRIARDQNQSPPDFIVPSAGDLSDWEDVLSLAMSGQWEETFAQADGIGYEVVEFLDVGTSSTFYVLREETVPGEPGFTGMGTYVFNENPTPIEDVVIQVPHPRWDIRTLDQGALMLPQANPRVLMIAGTHRNNDPTTSTCDGTFSSGDPYHISDVAHATDNFFHRTHTYLENINPDTIFVQLHGFCCPGSSPYESVSDDVIVSDGINDVPAPLSFARLFRDAIEDQTFAADDGTTGGDLTTAALYGEDVFVLGGTTNVQGRVTNGVAVGLECNMAASSSAERFIHLEQDPDVREEPQHIVDALIQALQDYDDVNNTRVFDWLTMDE